MWAAGVQSEVQLGRTLFDSLACGVLVRSAPVMRGRQCYQSQDSSMLLGVAGGRGS